MMPGDVQLGTGTDRSGEVHGARRVPGWLRHRSYAGGCTQWPPIMGLSNLQWPSLVATCCFTAGGIA